MWFQFTDFLRQIFQLWNYCRAQLFCFLLLSLRFSTRFSLSLFIVTCHGEPLLTELKMLQLISLVLVICGCGLLMVLDGFISILSSAFWTKSTLILLPLFRLQKGDSRSLCPRLSMEALTWFASVVSLPPNCALTRSRSFDPIVTADNERCFVLVRLVYADWSVVEMYSCVAVFLPIGVVNDGIGRFLR